MEMREKKEMKNSASRDAAGLFADFCQIIATLRGEQGCPWDREQTFGSLKPCMVNEMTEALAGIDLYYSSGKAENLCEELGDVLLQVALLSQIAQEKGLFSIEDVIAGVSQKMIRRHPHVFGSAKDNSSVPAQSASHTEEKRFASDSAMPVCAGEVPGLWEEIKRTEKKSKTPEEIRAEKEAFGTAASWAIAHLCSHAKGTGKKQGKP